MTASAGGPRCAFCAKEIELRHWVSKGRFSEGKPVFCNRSCSMSYRWKFEPGIKERASFVARRYGVARWSSIHLKNVPRPSEIRRKISVSHRGIKPSEATREKLRQANLGRKASEETRKRMSLSRIRFLLKNRKDPPSPLSSLTLDSFLPRPHGGRLAVPWLPDDSMIPHVAYVIGVIKGDGYITRHYTIGMAVTDKPFADSFADSLRKIGLSPKIHIHQPHNGVSKLPQWRVVAHSKMFYEWLTSMPQYKYEGIIEKYPKEFLRGFYESEGSCYRTGNGNVVSFCNTNPDVLIKIRSSLIALGFSPSKMYRRKNDRGCWNSGDLYIVQLFRSREAEKFIETINPVIKRGR